MNKWMELIVTLLLIGFGSFALIFWWSKFLLVLEGSIGVVLLLFGILFLLITIEDFKE